MILLTFRIIVELKVIVKKLNVIHNYDNIINNRSVNIWNSLNNDIIKSVSILKNKINKIYFDKQLLFNVMFFLRYVCIIQNNILSIVS